MKSRELRTLGIPPGLCVEVAVAVVREAARSRLELRDVGDSLARVVANPEAFLDDTRYGTLARSILDVRAARATWIERPERVSTMPE
jgi:hypothetical protein